MSLTDQIHHQNKPEQPSSPKILIRTNKQGKVEVVDLETNKILENIGRITVYINSQKKVSAEIELKNIKLELGIMDIKYEDS